MNRAFSIRSGNRSSGASSASAAGAPAASTTTATSSNPAGSSGSPTTQHHHHRRPFSFASLSLRAPRLHGGGGELSRRLARVVKTAGAVASAHESAARERLACASQLSEWGEHAGDAAVSDVADKVGVVLAELGEQEEGYARALGAARASLKALRDTERSVQPSRDGRARLVDDMTRLKAKEPQSARLVVLEQELVRAEAENLVAEAQLSNATRRKLKEAYRAEFVATVERAEKQTILARHGLRLLDLVDDTPVVPGDVRLEYPHAAQARQILNDAEDDLRDWRPDEDPAAAFVSRKEVFLADSAAGESGAAEAAGTGDGVVTAVEGDAREDAPGREAHQHQQQAMSGAVSGLDTPQRS